MKRKNIRTLFLTIVFICILLISPAAADSTGVCFISIGDRLTEYYPAFYSGAAYVPATLLSEVGVYYIYDSEASSVTLKSGAASLTMAMGSGTAVTADGTEYAAGAIWYGGLIYVSASSVSSYFGLTYSYINGTGYGDIVRIKNSSAWLTDKAFSDAASIHMSPRANSLIKAAESEIKPPSNPAATQKPASSSSQVADRSAVSVYLSFSGLPSEAILDELALCNLNAVFFLSEEDVVRNPSMVRRILGFGHRIGVLCGENPKNSYAETARLIFDAARENTILISSESDFSEQCREIAQEYSLVYCDYDIEVASGHGNESDASHIISLLASTKNKTRIRFACDEKTEEVLASVLQYLTSSKFRIVDISEYDN